MIRFEKVKKTYKSGVEALKGVDFTVNSGEFVFVIGKSGSGKSTLLKCITCEENPTEGKVTIDNFDISHMSRALVPVLRRQIGMIYQDFRLIDTKTVAENIAFAGEIIGVPKQSLTRSVQIMLKVVGLEDKADAYPQELSGGEQQRVAIARAMVNTPKIIVADEPTGNLDPETSENIMAMLLEINRSGTTVIVCTHDSNLVDRMQQRVVEIEEGLIVRDENESGYSEKADETPDQAGFGGIEAFGGATVTGLEGASVKHGDDGFGADSDYSDMYDEEGLPAGQGQVLFGDELPKPQETPKLPEMAEPQGALIESREGPAEIIEIKPEEVKAAEDQVLEEVPAEITLEQFDAMIKDEPEAEEVSEEAPAGDEEEPEEAAEDKEGGEESHPEPEDDKPLTRKQIREEKKRAKAELKQAKKQQKAAKKGSEASAPEEDIDLLGDEDS
ncbi:MAG: cell division ATP-binding protein FtsE [Clostridiales bacterium]|nr:cell division ATP-binding protein FtsE [Clostridiales bacterium]